MSKGQRRQLALHNRYFEIIAGHLYRRGVDQILRRCVSESDRIAILEEAHKGVIGGSFLR